MSFVVLLLILVSLVHYDVSLDFLMVKDPVNATAK